MTKKTTTTASETTTKVRERKTKLTFTFYFKEEEKGTIQATCPTLNEKIIGIGESRLIARTNFIEQFNDLTEPSIEQFKETVKDDPSIFIQPIELKEVRKRAKKPVKKVK